METNTTYQNLWDIGKTVPREKFRAIQVYLKKKEKNLKYSNCTPQGTRKSTKYKVIRRKEITKIKGEVN